VCGKSIAATDIEKKKDALYQYKVSSKIPKQSVALLNPRHLKLPLSYISNEDPLGF
jgi:hypothetical protein